MFFISLILFCNFIASAQKVLSKNLGQGSILNHGRLSPQIPSEENQNLLPLDKSFPPPAVCLSSSVLGVENEGDDPLDWLRSSIPGEPGTDYPIMAATQVSTHFNPSHTVT